MRVAHLGDPLSARLHAAALGAAAEASDDRHLVVTDLASLAGDVDLVHVHGIEAFRRFESMLVQRPHVLHLLAPAPDVPARSPVVLGDARMRPSAPQLPFAPPAFSEVAPAAPFLGEPLMIYRSPSLAGAFAEQVDVVLEQLARRLREHVVVVVPPTNVSYAQALEVRSRCHVACCPALGAHGAEAMTAMAQGLVVVSDQSEGDLAEWAQLLGMAPPLAFCRDVRDLADLMMTFVAEAASDAAALRTRQAHSRTFARQRRPAERVARWWQHAYAAVAAGAPIAHARKAPLGSSKEIVHLYDKTYYLGGRSSYNHQVIGVEGYQDFSRGEIYAKKIESAQRTDFRGKSVLDLGFGRGELLRYCKDHGAARCAGVDYSAAACEIAREFCAGRDVTLHHAALDELAAIEEMGGPFDVIYAIDVFEHVQDHEIAACLAQLAPHMAPGCQMVVETPCVQFGDYLEMHNNYHSAEGLQRLLAPYFAHVRVETEGPWYVVVATRDAATSQSQGPARPRYSAAQAAITSA